MSTAIEVTELEPGIPVPRRPSNDDVADLKSYIPSSMTEEDKKNLIDAALNVSDVIGGGAAIGIPARAFPLSSEAATNMYYFRHGDGQDRVLNNRNIEELENQSMKLKQFEEKSLPKFLKLVADDMAREDEYSVEKCYLFLNSGRSQMGSPDHYWIGMETDPGNSWYFAMNGFQISYGAHAYLKGEKLKIKYRLYIYDRYNWDMDKGVEVPKVAKYFMGKPLGPELLLDQEKLDKIEELEYSYYWEGSKGLNEQISPYFADYGGKYVFQDPFFGALATEGYGDFFDIVGSGEVQLWEGNVKRSE